MSVSIAPPELMARAGRWPLGLAVLLLALAATGQERPDRTFAAQGFRVLAAEGRDLVVLPSYRGALDAGRPASGGFSTQTYETASQRIHVVSFEGDTFRAATPLDGPRSWIVFDPARRAFAPLLPSIRIELNGGVHLDAVAAEIGALRVTVFKSLGFAILDLPADLHPADATARVRNLPGQPYAEVRLRGPRIEWR